MRYFTILLAVALLGGTDRLAAQEIVETRGITSEVKIDEVIFGHLTELNGRFKLRATELTFAPDGYVGVHHHIGPGIRPLPASSGRPRCRLMADCVAKVLLQW